MKHNLRFFWPVFPVLFVLQVSCGHRKASDYPITPVPFTAVAITDQFWKSRLDTNTKVTIPFAFQQCEATGRLRNFRVAGGLEEGTFSSKYPFDDSDVFKIIEGAAYSLHNSPDPALDAYLDTLIRWIGAAQEPDGYLYTYRTILGDRADTGWAGTKRWEKDHLHSHELYNIGHLYEAAVAHYQATGKNSLLDIALKSADLVDRDFGPEALVSYPGHQEIEIGLVRLYRLTGETRYLDLARFFLDSRRGGETYNQAHLPVVEQKEAVGHAVRAAYMYSGMADVAALTGDSAYIRAIDRIWEDVAGSKLYLTGGIGAAGEIEGFSGPYDLPNETAYCETCAGIANIFWNYRLFLLHGDTKYLDVLERTLYNNVLAGISLQGDEFFYPNPLESKGQYKRSTWFSCACCPSNVCRFIPSVPGYIYACDGEDVFINLFISSETEVELSRNRVKIVQESGLPWNGKADFTIYPDKSKPFALKIRIPGWAQGRPVPSDLYRFEKIPASGIDVQVNGVKTEYHIDQGFAVLERTWKSGDEVSLEFPMDIHRVLANPLLKADSGMVSLQRGPLVYCIEAADYPGVPLTGLSLSSDRALEAVYHPEILNGLVRLESTDEFPAPNEVPFIAIPYYAWAHRGAGEMKVWINK